MAEKKEHLQKLLLLVNQVANEPGNEWFKNELVSQFEISTQSIELNPIKKDTLIIRENLEIRAEKSIQFDFIQNLRVKKQLLKDNLRMENSRLDNNIKNETQRFHIFCVNAFYQIEELVNYYFGTKYTFADFIKLLQQKNPGKKYSQNQLSEITIAEKIFIFEGYFYFNQTDENGKKIRYESVINLIRDVRNEDAHRCNIIENDKENIIEQNRILLEAISTFNKTKKDYKIFYSKSEAEKVIEKKVKLINFIKDKNYNLIRDTVKEVANKIENEI
jgi:hypothetical protein